MPGPAGAAHRAAAIAAARSPPEEVARVELGLDAAEAVEVVCAPHGVRLEAVSFRIALLRGTLAVRSLMHRLIPISQLVSRSAAVRTSGAP